MIIFYCLGLNKIFKNSNFETLDIQDSTLK